MGGIEGKEDWSLSAICGVGLIAEHIYDADGGHVERLVIRLGISAVVGLSE